MSGHRGRASTGEGVVGEDDAAGGVEGGDAAGDGLLRACSGARGGGRRGWRSLRKAAGWRFRRRGASCLLAGGHVVEAADEFAELFGDAFPDAVGVVSLGDGFHGIGERFDGLGDLLGEVEREPTAGEEGQAGHHQEQQHI